MFRTLYLVVITAVVSLLPFGDTTAQEKNPKPAKAKPVPTPVWTDANDPALPIDYKFQGEYRGEKLGAQVIALGQGQFQAVILPGGLPGDGWNGAEKSLMQGSLKGDAVELAPATGNRSYLAGPADQFSATSMFPPVGQNQDTGSIDASGRLTLTSSGGDKTVLEKVTRQSSTLGAKAPAGAIVLFDGSNTDQWQGGRLDERTHWLNTDGQNIVSKRKFNHYTVHLEFYLPFRPEARGQGRGNSGFYQVNHYEVQVLDSFGLEGKNNECGGIYTKSAPKLNMCYPPLTWQTYDIDFTNSVAKNDAKVKNARVTVRLNGVVVQDNVEIDAPTGGHRNEPEGTPGPLLLQGHGNPLQYRNIWIVEKG